MEQFFFVIGALSALMGVAAGALGAHALKSRMSTEMLLVFEVGVRYQMYHAFALIATAWARAKWPTLPVSAAGWFFIAGTILCSFLLPAKILECTRVRCTCAFVWLNDHG